MGLATAGTSTSLGRVLNKLHKPRKGRISRDVLSIVSPPLEGSTSLGTHISSGTGRASLDTSKLFTAFVQDNILGSRIACIHTAP